jgi:hypothetical protein
VASPNPPCLAGYGHPQRAATARMLCLPAQAGRGLFPSTKTPVRKALTVATSLTPHHGSDTKPTFQPPPQKSPRHESGAVATSPAEAEPWFRPRTNRGPTCLRQAGKSGPRYTLPPRGWREGPRGHFVRQGDLPKGRLKSLWAAQLWGWPETRAGAGGAG